MDGKTKGYVCGIVSAVSYGTNPLGALSLYGEGITTNTVLFYRFALAALILGGLMLLQGKSFRVSKKELALLALLGVMFALSSLTLFISFHYMDAGVASTLLFVYPVIVAVLMAVFFKEKFSLVTLLSILSALCGIALLYRGGDGAVLDRIGVALVMFSSFSYALYIIVVNKSPLRISSVKLTFYILLFCILTVTIHSFFGENAHIQLLVTPYTWMLVIMLALVPTVISLVLMAVALHEIGSTPTAIMGALEPLTAVIIGITVFGEQLTLRLAMGILMILGAVILIITGKSFPTKKLTTAIVHMEHSLLKHWRWK